MKLLDIKALMAATEAVVTLSLGDVKIRRLSRIEWLTLMPSPPPGSSTWKPEEAVEKEQAWLEALEPGARVARRAEMLEAMYAAVARAVLEPAMTVDEVKRLGEDVDIIFAEIRKFWTAETNGKPEQVVAA